MIPIAGLYVLETLELVVGFWLAWVIAMRTVAVLLQIAHVCQHTQEKGTHHA